MSDFADRFWDKVDKKGRDECWTWRGATVPRGYGKISRDGALVYAHRASYELHCATIPSGMKVCHSCDTPSCVNPAHLFLGSQQDNMNDMKAKGRQNIPAKSFPGEHNPRAKLTESAVRRIRRMKGNNCEIARKVGLSNVQVRNIRLGISWKHVD